MYEDVPGQPSFQLHCPRCGSSKPRMGKDQADRQWHCQWCDTTWCIINLGAESPIPEVVEAPRAPTRSRKAKTEEVE